MNKYKNKKCSALGKSFDSLGERDRYLYLFDSQRIGLVSHICCQISYRLSVKGIHICKYIADFVYYKSDGIGGWEVVVEDFKGFETPVFKLKEKLMLACLGIKINVVKTPTADI